MKKKRKPFENELGILSRFLGKSFCVDFYTQKLFLKIQRTLTEFNWGNGKRIIFGFCFYFLREYFRIIIMIKINDNLSYYFTQLLPVHSSS